MANWIVISGASTVLISTFFLVINCVTPSTSYLPLHIPSTATVNWHLVQACPRRELPPLGPQDQTAGLSHIIRTAYPSGVAAASGE